MIERALDDYGFMNLVGHEIRGSIVRSLVYELQEYFDRPLEQKALDTVKPDNYRGYIPLGFFSPNNGIGESDVVFVPLEDGDRCEALRKMGKFVIVVDLNPLSRSAQKASLTIIDEITRVGNNLVEFVKSPIEMEEYQNEFFIEEALSHIAGRFL